VLRPYEIKEGWDYPERACLTSDSSLDFTDMTLIRIRLISWGVVLCLIGLIGAQMLPAPLSHVMSSETPYIGKVFALDPALLAGRIGTGDKARKLMPLVTPCSQSKSLCARVNLPAPTIRDAIPAFPHDHALRVYQRTSVYRI